MSFIYNKSSKESKVSAYPNKPKGLYSEGFFFRSDSNSEDLPNFAGAGLFDSYPLNDANEFRIKYHDDKLITDKTYREKYMNTLGKIGVLIENIYNEP